MPLLASAIIAVLVIVAGPAAAAEENTAGEPAVTAKHPPSPEERDFNEESARESEQARRLNRARKEHEARRTETTERLEAEQAREKEAAGLHGSVSGSTRRESYLNHERYWTRREYDSISRDPADLSAMARRGALEREMRDIGSELGTVGAVRDSAAKRLDTLRLR